jgi:hypothetical protein
MKIEIIEFLLKLPYLLAVCRHVGVTLIRLPHDLVADELRVTVDVKPLDLKLSGNVLAVNEVLIFCHIVCCTEIHVNHVEESISLAGNQNNAYPCSIEGE